MPIRLVGSLVLLAVGMLGGASTAAETPCTFGRYAIEGNALFGAVKPAASTDGVRHATVIVLDGNRVAIEGVCAPIEGRVTKGRRHTRIRARWDACDGIAGKVRLVGRIATDKCERFRGRILAKRAKVRRRFRAKLAILDGSCSAGAFDEIQRRIFGPRGCRVETCHGNTAAGGLDLRLGRAYEALVGVPATNDAAAAAGKRRVVPGDPDASFLVQKLSGTMRAEEGVQMPQVGRTLHGLEIDLVRAWIAGGAPATGPVEGGACLPAEPFLAAPPLTPPPGGHQIAFEGPILQPGEEYEGCMWIRVPNDADFTVGHFEFSLNPGTHHFALWDQPTPTPVEENVFKKDTACFSGGARFDGVTLSGAPEAPYYVDRYPAGIGRLVKGGSLIGINPHYHNAFDQPIQIKGWVNLHPVDGAVQHLAEGIVSTGASLNGKNPYSILVPPLQTATLRLRYTNTSGKAWHIFQLTGHQHQRGTRFTAWGSNGTKLFENLDWAHPAILTYDPPLVIPPGDWFEYECEHDNGVTRAVRRCGDSPFDTNCTPGDPVPVRFGVTSVDEMCLLTGLYYSE